MLGGFDGDLRRSVIALKYRGRRRTARTLARLMVPLVPTDCSLVTWAPTSPSRRRARGYDQAELLARHLAAATRQRWSCALRRLDPAGQTGRSRAERLRGPSFVASASVAGAGVVLVDDVVTTGATLRDASRALLEAGAARVVCVCVAGVS